LPEFPVEAYRPALGENVFRIDSGRSRADIVVRRGGKLARFGHDHVISATQLDGYILVAANDLKRSHADVRLALDSLIVDDPLLREQFALDTRPSAQDIKDTSENMHGKVLQTEFWPLVHLRLEITGGTQEALEAQLTLSLHGETHSFPITFKLGGTGMAHLQASGSFSLRQSDYGMEPLSILGGGLQVLDLVDVTFHLQADQVMQ
jgi:polyisoprenoid-binding protein YceI